MFDRIAFAFAMGVLCHVMRISKAALGVCLPVVVASVCLVASLFSQAYGQARATTDAPLAEGPPTGTLLQLMRGIFFPTSNLIFNVQTHDPAEKKVTASSGKESFDWAQWGSGLYSGWEDVDYAAVALAEATPLLLARGRLCQNGKPVPVDRADWVKYTQEMLRAARKTYEASRSRSQEAVSDSTNDLSDACQACHSVYRDRRAPGSTPGTPANQALRCTPP